MQVTDVISEITALPHAFETTQSFSLGAEEEFMLVEPGGCELAPRAASVVDDCRGGYPGSVDSEVVASVVECATPICSSPQELEASLGMHRVHLSSAAERAGCRLMSAGTHPFSVATQRIAEGDRYAAIARDYPWVVQQAATYGLHVHVGLQGADRAMAITNLLRNWLPHLLALSANSPFLRGEATGLQSTRVLLAQLFPRSGVPPVFADYDDYTRVIRSLELSEVVDDYTHTWWFVRPHPRYGTIEVRVCDAQTDVRRTAALAAVVQALVAWLDDQYASGDEPFVGHASVCEENLWSAARYGSEGTLIDERRGHTVSTRRAILDLLHELGPWFEQFGTSRYLPLLRRMVDHSGALHQLELLDRLGTLPAVADALARETHPGAPW